MVSHWTHTGRRVLRLRVRWPARSPFVLNLQVCGLKEGRQLRLDGLVHRANILLGGRCGAGRHGSCGGLRYEEQAADEPPGQHVVLTVTGHHGTPQTFPLESKWLYGCLRCCCPAFLVSCLANLPTATLPPRPPPPPSLIRQPHSSGNLQPRWRMPTRTASGPWHGLPEKKLSPAP